MSAHARKYLSLVFITSPEVEELMRRDDCRAMSWSHAIKELNDAEDQIDELVRALRAMVCMSDRGPQPKKLDAALTWRENDDKARAMADAALAKVGRS